MRAIPCVALLRAVNVGGRNTVSMGELRALFDELGRPGARTVLQSGNVVFEAAPAEVAGLAPALEAAFAERFGFATDIVIRTRDELAALEGRNPYLGAQPDGSRVHVVFLAGLPTPAAVAALDPSHSPPDEFTVDGREVFVHYPNGAGRSRLRLDLGTPGTARNWNTVGRLLALMEQRPG